MDLTDFVNHLDQLYTAHEFKDYGPNGLQVEGKRKVKKVACSVSASYSAIEHAIKWGADALVVHHGLFWDKSPCVVKGRLKSRLKLAFDYELSILAYHLPMDAHLTLGNNWPVINRLGWRDAKSFGEVMGRSIGVRAHLEPMAQANFLHLIESFYSSPIRTAGHKDTIQTAAVVSGGAHSFFKQATELGIDAFITGSADEPVWDEAWENNCLFVSVGHSASERVGPRLLSEYIQCQLGLESRFIEDTNPF